MGIRDKILCYLKKNDFVAVTAICIIVIVLVTLGFVVAEKISLGADKFPDDEKTDQTTQGVYGEPAVFSDRTMKSAIAEAIGVNEKELTVETLENVTSLQILNNSDIVSLEDIGLMPNLESLAITSCGVESIQPLIALTELKVLSLSGNHISDISDLVTMTQLKELDVSGNPIANIPDISVMQNLEVLKLDGTRIDNLAFMKDSAVSELHISYTKIESVEALSVCEKLECLYMYGYLFMDLTPLHRLPNFHSIYVSQGFDHSEVDFLIGRFKMADKYTKVYLVLKNRGLETNG